MRRIIYSWSFMLVLACCIGCSTTDQGPASSVVEGSEIRVYEVFGMDCPGCQGGVEKLVKKIPAVQDAKADWKKKKLTVAVRPGSDLDDEDVLDAIRRANFTPGKRIQ